MYKTKKIKKNTLHFISKKQVHSSIFTTPNHCNNKIENEEGECKRMSSIP
jgi:hypothetical protein